MHNFTPEDLLEFFYNDMPKPLSKQLDKALKNNWALREKMRVIEEAGKRLDKSICTPRAAVIEKIMDHARNQVGQNLLS